MENKTNPQETILSIWTDMTEHDKVGLLPKLLTRTEGWSAWSSSDFGIISWLKWIFELAETSFRHQTFDNVSSNAEPETASGEVPPLRATAHRA
jgi:hypothetical protein